MIQLLGQNRTSHVHSLSIHQVPYRKADHFDTFTSRSAFRSIPPQTHPRSGSSYSHQPITACPLPFSSPSHLSTSSPTIILPPLHSFNPFLPNKNNSSALQVDILPDILVTETSHPVSTLAPLHSSGPQSKGRDETTRSESVRDHRGYWEKTNVTITSPVDVYFLDSDQGNKARQSSDDWRDHQMRPHPERMTTSFSYSTLSSSSGSSVYSSKAAYSFDAGPRALSHTGQQTIQPFIPATSGTSSSSWTSQSIGTDTISPLLLLDNDTRPNLARHLSLDERNLFLSSDEPEVYLKDKHLILPSRSKADFNSNFNFSPKSNPHQRIHIYTPQPPRPPPRTRGTDSSDYAKPRSRPHFIENLEIPQSLLVDLHRYTLSAKKDSKSVFRKPRATWAGLIGEVLKVKKQKNQNRKQAMGSEIDGEDEEDDVLKLTTREIFERVLEKYPFFYLCPERLYNGIRHTV